MSESSPEHFFETWLPRTFEQVRQRVDTSAVTDCSLLVEVGTKAWRVAVQSGVLRVEPNPTETTSTFRAQTDDESFHRLAENVHLVNGDTYSGELKLLRLDEETCRLVDNVPQAIRLVVVDEPAKAQVVLAPGSVDPANVGCTVTCQLEDLRKVRAGQANPMELFMSGRLTLDGNVEVAMALGGLFL